MSKFNKNKLTLIIVFVLLILIINVGYAKITNIDLKISSRAGANKVQDNFDVSFVKIEEINASNDNIQVSSEIINDTYANFNILNMEGYGDNVKIKYSIRNNSQYSTAKFTVDSIVSNQEYFSVDTFLTNSDNDSIVSILPGETIYLTVKASIKKVSIDVIKNANVEVKIKAIQTD